MSDLKPCPFCGGEAEPFNPFGNTNGTWCVLCSECASATGFEQTEAEAIAAWDTRVDYHGYEQAAIEAWESIKAWNSRAERTCKVLEHDELPYAICSECGAIQPDDFTVYYCWACGAKVVGE